MEFAIRQKRLNIRCSRIDAFRIGEIFMKINFRVLMSAVIVPTLMLGWGHSVAAQTDQKGIVWKAHDRNRPAPAAVDPGDPGTQTSAGRAPADAIVLFDGKDLSKWTHKDGSPAKWKVTGDYFEVVPKTKDIITKQPFGDMQLHVEFREPAPPVGEDQDRGNSGVIIMGLYEIQVLDSYQSKTYPDGQAGAVYGQYPPLVNVSRPPGQWQTYDIVFHAPRFDAASKLLRPAHVTVLQNGVLVQDNAEIHGPTATGDPYQAHAAKLPLQLQDHNHPVRFRNIWVRELAQAE
jgi:Domain of Unknown Function (DUF1080)